MDDVHQMLDERTLASDISILIASGINGLADLDAKGIIMALIVLLLPMLSKYAISWVLTKFCPLTFFLL
jgi:hypothetical protein